MFIITGIAYLVIHLSSGYVSPPYQSGTYQSCYDNSNLCFETDTSKKYDSSLNSKDLCPPGKTLPQIFGQVEQLSLVQFMATLPKNVKYYIPLGLNMKRLPWKRVIGNYTNYLLDEDNDYLVMKIDRKVNQSHPYELEAVGRDDKYPFGCLTTDPCKVRNAYEKKNTITTKKGCLTLPENQMCYYCARNYCQGDNSTMLGYSDLIKNQQLLDVFPTDQAKFWMVESRLDLCWMDDSPAVFTRWKSGHPERSATLAYVRSDDEDGFWNSLQPGEKLADKDDDDDDDERVIVVCSYRNGATSPNINTGNSNPLNVGLGVGISLGMLVLIIVVVVTIVACLRIKKSAECQTRKMPSSSTETSLDPTDPGQFNYRVGGVDGGYIDDSVGRSVPAISNGRLANNQDWRNNQVGSYQRPGGLYEEIRSYELPDNSPIVEHVYNAMRQPPTATQSGPDCQAPSQFSNNQQRYLQMNRNPYLDLYV